VSASFVLPDPGLFVAWATLVVCGGVLTAAVRRRDRRRDAPRTTALWHKFMSYVVITGGVLIIGGLPFGAFAAIGAVGALLAATELVRSALATGRNEPSPRAPHDPAEFATGIPPRSRDTVLAIIAGGALVTIGLAGTLAVARLDPAGNLWGYLWLLVASTDAFAQLFGQGWGERRMTPRLSPEKTWVGFVGGLASAALVGLSLGYLLPGWSLGQKLGLALATSLAATAGDLLESAIKRALAIKDFSHLFGLHGGLLDRFDSLLGAAPVFAATVWLVGRTAP
jgi:hypothetical protein